MSFIRNLFRLICLLLLIGSFVQIVFKEYAQSSSKTQVNEDNSDIIVNALEKQKKEIEEKEKRLNQQEQALKEREKEFDKKIKELEALRAGVNSDFDHIKKNNDDKIIKMVTAFENMAPKAAGAMFEVIDDTLAVEVLKRIETKKMAKILAIMDKSRSAKLSEMLTGYYRVDQNRKVSSLPVQKNSVGQVNSIPKAAIAAEAKPQVPTPAVSNPLKGGKQ